MALLADRLLRKAPAIQRRGVNHRICLFHFIENFQALILAGALKLIRITLAEHASATTLKLLVLNMDMLEIVPLKTDFLLYPTENFCSIASPPRTALDA